jgi:hypothetical protein
MEGFRWRNPSNCAYLAPGGTWFVQLGAYLSHKSQTLHKTRIKGVIHMIYRLSLCLVAAVVFNLSTGYTAAQTPLMEAAKKGDTEKVQALLAQGADVNAKGNDGFTALIMAARYGHTDIVQALLAKGANVNAKHDRGWTALITAAWEGHTDIVQALLTQGADVNAKDDRSWTALIWAADYGHTDTVQALLAKGANVNTKDGRGLDSPDGGGTSRPHKYCASLAGKRCRCQRQKRVRRYSPDVGEKKGA